MPLLPKIKVLANEDTLLRTHCCGHIVAHDVSWAAQTGKHLLRTQNVSEPNQIFYVSRTQNPGHKICVRNKCYACGQTGKHLCRQQCIRNDVSSFARAFTLESKVIKSHECPQDLQKPTLSQASLVKRESRRERLHEGLSAGFFLDNTWVKLNWTLRLERTKNNSSVTAVLDLHMYQ